MNKSIQIKISLLAASIIALLMLSVSSAAHASTIGELCTGANLTFEQSGSRDCAPRGDNPESKLTSLVRTIVNIFSVIVGIVAVIMIIYGGFKYITSGGDSGNVSGAKNTILYAIIGLIIVALAQIIVKFILNRTSQAVT